MDKKYKEITTKKQEAERKLETLRQQYENYPELLQRLEEASVPLQESFGLSNSQISAKLQVILLCAILILR